MIHIVVVNDVTTMYDAIMKHLETPLNCEDQQAIKDGIAQGFREITAADAAAGPEAVTMLSTRKPKGIRKFFRKRG